MIMVSNNIIEVPNAEINDDWEQRRNKTMESKHDR